MNPAGTVNATRMLQEAERRLSAGPPVAVAGWLPAKNNRIEHPFESCNFSFVVKGRGFYDFRGERLKVRAPMVLTQWPGEPMCYGPEGEWSELFLIYPPTVRPALDAAGFFAPDRCCWPVRSPERFGAAFDRLFRLVFEGDPEANIDRVDLAAWELILESLLEEETGAPGRYESAFLELAAELRRAPERFRDWDEEARRLRLSGCTFRRYFARYLGKSPAAYLQERRMLHARQLLIGSRRPIAGIAAACGFSDPFYFSRRFRLECGCSPGEYRRRYGMTR